MALNSDIQDSFKECLLLFCQAEMIFVIVWPLDHFTFKRVPTMNSNWIMTFVSHLHAWITKFKPSLMFFQLSVLTSNNIVWVNFFAILFNEIHSTSSKYPWRATCLFAMRSLIFSLSLKFPVDGPDL